VKEVFCVGFAKVEVETQETQACEEVCVLALGAVAVISVAKPVIWGLV